MTPAGQLHKKRGENVTHNWVFHQTQRTFVAQLLTWCLCVLMRWWMELLCWYLWYSGCQKWEVLLVSHPPWLGGAVWGCRFLVRLPLGEWGGVSVWTGPPVYSEEHTKAVTQSQTLGSHDYSCGHIGFVTLCRLVPAVQRGAAAAASWLGSVCSSQRSCEQRRPSRLSARCL